MSWIIWLISQAIVEGSLDETKSNAVKELRVGALQRLPILMGWYLRKGFDERIVTTICEKKIAFILEATSKREIELILSPPKPHYNYSEIVPGNRYSIPEEELLMWSLASLVGLLNQKGVERFMELFQQIYPDKCI